MFQDTVISALSLSLSLSTYFYLPIPMLLQNILCNLQTPMQQRLPYHRTNLDILSCRIGRQNLVTNLTPKTSLQSGTFAPSRNLLCVIGTSSSRVESTVSLEPSVRIRVGNPTGRFPHSERSTAFDLVFVDGFIVFGGS